MRYSFLEINRKFYCVDKFEIPFPYMLLGFFKVFCYKFKAYEISQRHVPKENNEIKGVAIIGGALGVGFARMNTSLNALVKSLNLSNQTLYILLCIVVLVVGVVLWRKKIKSDIFKEKYLKNSQSIVLIEMEAIESKMQRRFIYLGIVWLVGFVAIPVYMFFWLLSNIQDNFINSIIIFLFSILTVLVWLIAMGGKNYFNYKISKY